MILKLTKMKMNAMSRPSVRNVRRVSVKPTKHVRATPRTNVTVPVGIRDNCVSCTDISFRD